MKKLVLGVFVFFGVFSAYAYANAEDAMVQQAQNEAELKKITDEMNATCGSSIAVTIDWDSFAESDWQQYHVASFCGAPVEGLSDFCSAEKGNSKAYIRKKVKRVTCTYGGEGKRALSIEKGKINLIVDFNAPNLDDFVHAELLKQL